MEIKCQLDATDEFYCRSYCLLNMFRAPLCPSSGAREYYTSGCCLLYLVLWFSSCRYGVELRVVCPVCGLLHNLLHLVGILFPQIKTHISCWITLFFQESYRIWDNGENIVQPDRPQMTTRRNRIAWRITRNKNTHSERVILIDFLMQQMLHERALMLRCT